VLAAIHPALGVDAATEAAFQGTAEVLTWYTLLYQDPQPAGWLVYLLGLLAGRPAAEGRSLLRRLMLPPTLAARLGEDLSRLRLLIRQFRQARELPPSRVYRWLAEASLEAALALMARMERTELRRAIGDFLTRGRQTRPLLRGDDLRSLGLPPGPIYRDILNSLRYARLDGQVQSRDDELRFVRRRFAALLAPEEGQAKPQTESD